MFCRCWNWKCVKLKCPEIKTVEYMRMSCNKLKAEESGSLRFAQQPEQINWGCIRDLWGRIELIIMNFALGRGPLLSFLSDLQGHFSQLGYGPENGQLCWLPTKYLWAINSCCWREGLYQCLEETFSLTLTTALCSDWLCKKWPSESCFSFEVCFCPTGVNNLVALLGLKPCIFKGRESNESACLHLN